MRDRLLAETADELRISAVKITQRNKSGQFWPFLKHPGTAACLCVDEEMNVLVVRQYRPVVGAMLIEVPGGVLRPGETARKAAIRETFEETGIRPTRLINLVTCFPSVGVTNERIHVFLSQQFSGRIRSEKGLRAFWLPLRELVDATLEGRDLDAKTAVGILLLERRFVHHL
jgi:8-oxo-dGTP pyrophosphatase MutT (NUDIX family)